MGATDARTTRAARVLALAVALLTALTLLAPAMTRGAEHAPEHLRVLKLMAPGTADQASLTVRIDQPVAAVHTHRAAILRVDVAERPSASSGAERAGADSTEARGPPPAIG